MSEYYFNTQEVISHIDELTAGDRVMLSGVVYTARDAAHKRIMQLIESGEKLPFELDNAFG